MTGEGILKIGKINKFVVTLIDLEIWSSCFFKFVDAKTTSANPRDASGSSSASKMTSEPTQNQASYQKYSGDLKFRLVWISNGWKEVGLHMVRISNEIWNPEAQPSIIGHKAAILSKTICFNPTLTQFILRYQLDKL